MLAINWSARACIAGRLAQATCGVSRKLGSASRLGRNHRVAGRRRLGGDDVEAGASDPAFLERADQRRLVDDAAARGVDQQRTRLHRAQFRFADQPLGRRRQRAVQCQGVGFAQHLLEIGVAGARRRHALVLGAQHAHAEGTGEAGDAAAQAAAADDAERGAVEVADRVVEQAELVRLLPAPGLHRGTPGDQVARQREQQRKDVLGHGVLGIAAHVGDDDAALAAGVEVDDVGAGRGHCDHFQVRQRVDRNRRQRRLVDDGDGGALQPLDDLVRPRLRVLDPVVREGRPADIGDDRLAFEVDDALAHAAGPTKRVPQRAAMAATCAPRSASPA